MNRNKSVTVGSVSLLLIFSVLCLTVFCVLSLVTAKNDQARAERLAQATSAYYQADCKAAAIYSQLKTSTPGQEPEMVNQTTIRVVRTKDRTVFAFVCPINSKMGLAVTLLRQNNSFEVLQWAQCALEEWKAEEAIAVFGGVREACQEGQKHSVGEISDVSAVVG